jgi:hypothetical protein
LKKFKKGTTNKKIKKSNPVKDLVAGLQRWQREVDVYFQ